MLSWMLGALAAAMIDPIVALLGLAAFLIGRRFGTPALVLAVFCAGVALFVVANALAGGLPDSALALYLAAIAAWSLLCDGAVRLFNVYRNAMR